MENTITLSYIPELIELIEQEDSGFITDSQVIEIVQDFIYEKENTELSDELTSKYLKALRKLYYS